MSEYLISLYQWDPNCSGGKALQQIAPDFNQTIIV